MAKRNIYLLVFVLALFGFCLWSVVPLDRSVRGRQGLSLGLDLKGGSYLVYQADLSQVEPGSEGQIMEGVKGVIERRINALGISEPIVEIQRQEAVTASVFSCQASVKLRKPKKWLDAPHCLSSANRMPEEIGLPPKVQ